MFMPLSLNIEKFNTTVIIQSSVSMYTDVFSVLLFNITENLTGPASSDLKKHSVPSLSPCGIFCGLSAHVRFSV